MSTEHVASSIVLHVCQVVCCLFFLHVCQVLCFTISSNLVLPIFVFCLFFSLPMKMAPCILLPPPTWSGSLYYYKGGSISNRSDAETAEIYFRRVMVARAETTELRTKWQQQLASDLASCTRWHRDPTPVVLKSKWKAKWDGLQSKLTPHQRVDMHLAKQIWSLNVWKRQGKRISAGKCWKVRACI